MRAEEGGVAELFFEAFFCADIEAVAFQVDAEKVSVGVHLCEPHGVFAFSAGEFEGERVGILKKPSPMSRHPFRVLEDIGKKLYRFESDEFFLAHWREVSENGRSPSTPLMDISLKMKINS